jgi:hypothetical protein
VESRNRRSPSDNIIDVPSLIDDLVLILPLFPSFAILSRTFTEPHKYFHRISSFFPCVAEEPNCNTDVPRNAEIVAAANNGNTLLYTDVNGQVIGFVDITDPADPKLIGVTDSGGEANSVAACGDYAIAGVRKSDTNGTWIVLNVATREIVREVSLDGVPDSVAMSPDCTRAVIAIENEDPDGNHPALPAGFVVVIDKSSTNVNDWSATAITLAGNPDIPVESEDPQPEYVHINSDGIAAVSLQENNAIALINTKDNSIVRIIDAGTVTMDNVDLTEDPENVIDQSETLTGEPRGPDGVAWMSNMYFATADEENGRGFTIFNTNGDILYTSEGLIDQLAAKIGHYVDSRSGNKGCEPSNIVYGEYGFRGSQKLLFVISERCRSIYVFDVGGGLLNNLVTGVRSPELLQILPAGEGPEGGLVIPERDLLIVTSEFDRRSRGIRSYISIYQKRKWQILC